MLETVNDLPQEFELEDLIERLLFVEKVEKGIKQMSEGRTLTHDQVKNNIKEWRK